MSLAQDISDFLKDHAVFFIFHSFWFPGPKRKNKSITRGQAVQIFRSRQSLAQSVKNLGHGHDTISCPKPSSQKKRTAHKFQEDDIVCSRITDRFSSMLSWMYDYGTSPFPTHGDLFSKSHAEMTPRLHNTIFPSHPVFFCMHIIAILPSSDQYC